MQNETTLTERVVSDRRTSEGRRRLVAELSLRAYRYVQARRDCDEDDPGEFLLFFLPKLDAVVGRYRAGGAPFEHYFNSVLRWNMSAYFRDKRIRRDHEEVARTRELWEPAPDSARAGTPACGKLDTGRPPAVLGAEAEQGSLCRGTDRRRLLVMALRAAWYLEPHQLSDTAALLGVSERWLGDRVERMRALVTRKLGRVEQLRYRRNRAYGTMRALERTLPMEQPGPRRVRLEERLRVARRVWLLAVEDLGRVSLAPSHREVADELALPRGTVNTDLRWARLRYRALQEEGALEYA